MSILKVSSTHSNMSSYSSPHNDINFFSPNLPQFSSKFGIIAKGGKAAAVLYTSVFSIRSSQAKFQRFECCFLLKAIFVYAVELKKQTFGHC